MNRWIVWTALVVAPSMAGAQEFSSEPALLSFQAQHPVVDQDLNFPIGFDLDLIFDTYWIGIDISLQGLANFGLVMEGESQLTWNTRDGNDGLVFQTIEPLTGANSIGVQGEANFLVSFDIRQGGASGNPIVSIGLLSESAGFDVVTRDFLPFLLPGQSPSYETVTSNSTDASLRLPFNLDILDVGILSIGAGFEIIGYPTVTATITGESLTTTHGLDVYEIDRDLSPTPIQLYEATPALELETTYLAGVQAFIGYVVNADLSFSITLFGVDVLPISIPLFDETFQLFSGQERVDFPALEYNHPLPVASVPVPNIDFGVLEVDEAQTFTLPFNNDGELELVGLVGLDGDPVFSASPVELYAGPGGQDAVVVTFEPKSVGPFEATLYVETSDPVQPVVEIPLRGEAVAPASDDPFNTNDDPVFEDNPGSSLYNTCGCAAGRGGSDASWLGLMGLVLLGRRRRA